MSVRRRLVLLVVLQSVIASLLVLIALKAISQISTDAHYMYRFQLASAAEMSRVREQAAILRMLPKPEVTATLIWQLEDFLDLYRKHWQTSLGEGEEAADVRRELFHRGKSALAQREMRALAGLEESLQSLKKGRASVQEVSRDISELFAVNAEYAAIANEQVIKRAHHAWLWLLIIGMAGTGSTLTLGLLVNRAITPRIRRLVGKVNRFRDRGVNEQVVDRGNDEIAILANALDTGFSAIATRDQERNQFLAVVAHELMPEVEPAKRAAAIIARAGPSVPIVLVTAAADPGRRAAELKINRWLAKPFEMSALESLFRKEGLLKEAA